MQNGEGEVKELSLKQLDAQKCQKRWVQEIKFYETKSNGWSEKGKKIIKRYKDERSERDQHAPRFNILWSNVQTLKRALYSRIPKADIERRFRDKDDLGRMASMILERSTDFFLNDQFDEAVKNMVLDRLLPGRGVMWVRYEPHFKDSDPEYAENEETENEGLELTDDVTETNDGPGDDEPDAPEVSNEIVAWDYVHWEDFGHTYGRTWQEVSARWRKVYLTREECIDRFGEEIGKEINLDYSPHDNKDNKFDEIVKKATIYEIWSLGDKKVYWVHKDYLPGPLDVKDDPLNLTDFWPCEIISATLANDTVIPVPDYQEYQDQANELDELTSRIGAITKAVKVVGIYAGEAAAVERILAEGVENQLVPVSQWALFAEKGGLKNMIELLPMQEILQTLLGLYEARDKVKSDLYEITGIADILRGTSEADETATAQGIKATFGTMRLQDMQDDVKKAVRNMVKKCAEIEAQHFSIETIKKISGVQLLTAQEKQLVQTYAQMKQQAQQNPQLAQMLPQLPDNLKRLDQEDIEELMNNPTWEEVEGLLKDETMLSYKIDIETDSTIKFDEDQEKTNRIEFLQATGSFLESAAKNTNPDLAPLLGKLLQFGVRGFKVGKELESAFEIAINKLEKDAQNPQQKPDPEMAKVQGELKIQQAQFESDQAMEQLRMQAEQQKAALEQQTLQLQARIDQANEERDRSFEEFKAKLDSETKLAVAQIQAKTQLQTAQISKSTPEGGDVSVDENGNTVKQPGMADLMTTVIQQLQTALTGMQAGHEQIAQSQIHLANQLGKPKQVLRDANGNIVGVQ